MLGVQLRAEGRTWAEAADVLGQKYGMNARAALRVVRGWSQATAAAEWSKRWPDDVKMAKNFSHWETWPVSGYAPSLEVLDRLAQLYECSVADLVADLGDHRDLDAIGPPDQQRRGRARSSGSELVVRSDPLHLGLSPVSASALVGGIAAPALPDRVTPVEVNQIRDAAAFFEGWDFAYGGGIVREAVMAQLRWSAALLGADHDASHRSDLFSVVGYLAHTCAFMAFDDLATDDAWQMWRLALACAEEADDWPLRATILSALARQAMWLGRFDEGLTQAELALVRADRLSTIEQAKLHATKARLLAAMGRSAKALAALEAADTCFSATAPADVPPWMTYYDAAEHAGDTGHALADLAMHDRRVDAARTRLAAAVAGHTATFARSEALCQARVATLVMAVGDPHEAAQLGHGAVERARPIRSRRLGHYLGELAQQASRHQSIVEVTELRERLADPEAK